MRAWRTTGIVLLAILTAAVMALVAGAVSSRIQTSEEQAALQPFYDVPSPLPGPPGTVIRTEPLGVTVPGATALRMLYVSERPDGTPAASGGMLFIPDSPAPPEGRPVVAWAHGTLGHGRRLRPVALGEPAGRHRQLARPDDAARLGRGRRPTTWASARRTRACTSSRSRRCATSSTPCGRPATSPRREAGTRYATWGHSQGGHSSVWTGHLGEEYAPELDLLGVAAAAPALELGDIMGAQWDTLVGWVIGSDVVESWPQYYPDLPVDDVLTPIGQDIDARLASDCIKESGQEALVRKTLGQDFFSVDPTSVPAWADGRRRPDSPAAARGHARLHRAGHGRHRGAAVAQRHRPGGVVRGGVVDLDAVDGRRLAPGRRDDGRAVAQWRGWTTGSRGARRPRTCDTPPPVAAAGARRRTSAS